MQLYPKRADLAVALQMDLGKAHSGTGDYSTQILSIVAGGKKKHLLGNIININ